MKRLLFIAFLLALVALPARATDFASSHLLIPIAGRTAGGFYSVGFSPEAIAALRCEGTVRVIEQNGYVPVF